MAIENIMNDKVKKVLSYIGVACLGAFLGMGALIGVSSCSKQDNQQQLKAKVNKKQQYFGYDLENLYTLKSLSVLSTGYHNINGFNFDLGIRSETQPYLCQFRFDGDFNLVNDSQSYNRLQAGFSCSYVNATTPYIQFQLNYLLVSGNSVTWLYQNNAIVNDSVLKVNVDRIVYFDDYLNFGNGVDTFMDYYFNKFDSGNLFTFDFAEQINYYAPYMSDISNYYVTDSNMGASGQFNAITYNFPNFVSGGFVFNQIKVYYYNAISTSYLDDNGNRQVWSVNGFATYSDMEYINTRTNKVVIVNKRRLDPFIDGSASGYNQGKGSYWLSNDFKTLIFSEQLLPQERLNLSQFNNNQYGDSFSVLQNNDIGLGNVFSLLTLAFSSWLPILSIQIVPGITLGLLMFIPLIAGIIILVIWIVKR